MTKMNEGMFFTLSMFLLVTSVLFLALIIFGSYKNSIERTAEMTNLDRISDISGSIEKSMANILNLSFRNDVIIEENPDGTTNVTITESLSRQQEDWSLGIEEEMENFKTFVEENEEHVSLNIASIENKELPMVIYPHNITYTRSWQIGHVVLSVVPQEMNLGSYDVVVYSGNVRISDMTSQFRKKGSFKFRVRGKDNYGFDETDGEFVDPSDNHQVQIFFTGDNKVKVTVHDNNLKIWTNTNETITIETTIDNLDDLGEKVTTDYFESALKVIFSKPEMFRIRPLVLRS